MALSVIFTKIVLTELGGGYYWTERFAAEVYAVGAEAGESDHYISEEAAVMLFLKQKNWSEFRGLRWLPG